MHHTKLLAGSLCLTGLALAATAAAAATELQSALTNGAVRLTAVQIAETMVGKTVKAQAGQKTFLFHYSDDNILTGRLVGGNWSDVGYYGITDDNRVCISMTKDAGRLRCLTLLRQGDTVMKYDVNGKMTFELLEFEDGKNL